MVEVWKWKIGEGRKSSRGRCVGGRGRVQEEDAWMGGGGKEFNQEEDARGGGGGGRGQESA